MHVRRTRLDAAPTSRDLWARCVRREPPPRACPHFATDRGAPGPSPRGWGDNQRTVRVRVRVQVPTLLLVFLPVRPFFPLFAEISGKQARYISPLHFTVTVPLRRDQRQAGPQPHVAAPATRRNPTPPRRRPPRGRACNPVQPCATSSIQPATRCHINLRPSTRSPPSPLRLP